MGLIVMKIGRKLTVTHSSRICKKSIAFSFSVIRLLGLLLVGYIVLYPLLYMVSSAVKTKADFLDVSHQWLPLEVTLEQFQVAFKAMNFVEALKQTMLLQVLSACMEVMICAFVAYGFARFQFRGKRLATVFLILSLLIPVQMYSLSLSVNYRILHIFNTPFAYWLPSVFGVGVRSGIQIFIFQQFFIGLPKELEDAAYVDGAGPIRTYFKIALPSSGVAIVTVSVLSLIWHWNEYYLAELCFLNEKRPLAVTIGNLSAALSQLGIQPGSAVYPAAVSAACLLFIAIPLVFYMVVQRNFVKSIDRVGITG